MVLNAQRTKEEPHKSQPNKHVIHHHISKLVCTQNANIYYITGISTTFWYTFTLFIDNGSGAMHGYHIETGETLTHPQTHEISIPI